MMITQRVLIEMNSRRPSMISELRSLNNMPTPSSTRLILIEMEPSTMMSSLELSEET
jgi:hypothetical protein